jgi:hypothetical protein
MVEGIAGKNSAAGRPEPIGLLPPSVEGGVQSRELMFYRDEEAGFACGSPSAATYGRPLRGLKINEARARALRNSMASRSISSISRTRFKLDT